MALKDIINSAKYGDDIVLQLPDGTTATIGEMRSLSAEDRQSLVQRQQMVEQAELAIATKVAEFQRAGLLGPNGQPMATVPRTDADIRTAAAQEYGLDPNDPLLGPVVKAFKEEMGKRDQAIESMRNQFGTALREITGVVQTAVSANLEERYQSDYKQATSALPDGVKVDYQEAFEYASKNGLKDKFGRLDISQAVDRITWPKVKEAQLATLTEQATKAAQDQQRLATATRPRVSGPEAHRPKTDFTPVETITDPKTGRTREVTKSFDQALAEASNDDALLQSALSTASFGLVQ